MSLHFETSPKHCGSKQHSHGGQRSLRKRLLFSLFSCLFSLAVAALLIYLILHPTKPRFYLREADLFRLSLAPPRLLNSTLEFTLVSTNPNARVGVYYDKLRAYAAYHGQRITTAADIPPFYQGHEDTNLLSASLYGNAIPVAASLGYEVVRDQTAGKMLIKLRIDGRLRWKVGSWVSPQYHVDVDCTAIMGFGTGGAVRSMEGTQCSTTV